jgi:hypothetical protein
VQLDKEFEDNASGKNMDWPELKKALQYVRDGDTLIAHNSTGPRATWRTSLRWSMH